MFSKLRKSARHPVRAITEPFGKAGLTVAVVALVVSMAGGAYAAGKLTSSQKKEVEKIAKKFAGKPGAPGANGTNGANGKDGAPGARGENGAPGGDGEDGKSVTLVSATPPGCLNGGFTYEIEGSGQEDEVCNGEEGSPWVVGTAEEGTLMKGTWAIQQYTAAAANEQIAIPISTSVPIRSSNPVLESGLLAVFKIGGVEEPSTAAFPGGPYCTGTADAPTVAHAGVVCVYAKTATNLKSPGFNQSVNGSGGGAVVLPKSIAAGAVSGYGSWALSAP